MTDNLRIWAALEKTDPKHTKNFTRGGGFKGTAMKPIWLAKRLTEKFGPCGTGWGMEKPEFQVVPAGDETLVFCTVALWYWENGVVGGAPRPTVYGVGGDKVMGKNKYGPFMNDEAFKASYTDALSNAMKQIGVGADIHMGLFDDEKYVRETAKEFAAQGFEADPDITANLAPNGRDAEGNIRSAYDAGKAAKAKKFADDLITVLNTATKDEAKKVWTENWKAPKGTMISPLAWLEKHAPEQFQRVSQAHENAV